MIKEKLSSDIRQFGLNGDYAESGNPGDFDIEIRNSRDDADEFGTNPFVSRIVIGGTTEEAGLTRMDGIWGLAPWADVGNFSTDDDAVLLLDHIARRSAIADRIKAPLTYFDLLGMRLGIVAAHEAGHIFGDCHTDLDVASGHLDVGMPNIMDPFQNFRLVVAGADGLYGTVDDGDYDFGVDRYLDDHCSVTEDFNGIEDTLNVIAFGLATGTAPAFRCREFLVHGRLR